MSTSIEALNMAYGVNEDRPWWKTRLLSIALALLIGVLLVTAFSVMIVGPRFAEWLASKIGPVCAVCDVVADHSLDGRCRLYSRGN